MNEKAEQAKKNLQEIFRNNPELKQAFKETLDEMRKPENVEKMSKDICSVMQAVRTLRNKPKE